MASTHTCAEKKNNISNISIVQIDVPIFLLHSSCYIHYRRYEIWSMKKWFTVWCHHKSQAAVQFLFNIFRCMLNPFVFVFIFAFLLPYFSIEDLFLSILYNALTPKEKYLPWAPKLGVLLLPTNECFTDFKRLLSSSFQKFFVFISHMYQCSTNHSIYWLVSPMVFVFLCWSWLTWHDHYLILKMMFYFI